MLHLGCVRSTACRVGVPRAHQPNQGQVFTLGLRESGSSHAECIAFLRADSKKVEASTMWHTCNIIHQSLNLTKKKLSLESGLALESRSSTHMSNKEHHLVRGMILMKINATRSSTCSCRRSRSIYPPTIDSHQLKNSRRRSGASGTTPIRITPMNAVHSNRKFKWLSSNDVSNGKSPKSR
jgi:hypothetical protein